MADRTSSVIVNFVAKLAKSELGKVRSQIKSAAQSIGKDTEGMTTNKFNKELQQSRKHVDTLKQAVQDLKNRYGAAMGEQIADTMGLTSQISQADIKLRSLENTSKRLQAIQAGSIVSAPGMSNAGEPSFRSTATGQKVSENVAQARKQMVRHMGTIRELGKTARETAPAMHAMFDKRVISRGRRFTEGLTEAWDKLSLGKKFMTDFGRASIETKDKIVEFSKGLGDALSNMNPFADSTRQSTNATREFARNIGTAMTQLFGFILLIRTFTKLQDLIREGFQDLSEAMSEAERTVSTFKEATVSAMDTLERGISLARRFGITVGEATHGLRRAMSGVPKDLEDIELAQEAVAKATQLSLLANTELDDAIQLASRTFTVFGDKTKSAKEQLEEMAKVMDIVAVAVRTAGAATVEDFADQLPKVLNMADALGFSLEEVVSVASAMEKLLPMDRAMTGFRNLMQQVIKDNEELSQVAAMMGLEERFDAMNLSQQGLLDTGRALEKVFISQGLAIAGLVQEGASWAQVQETLQSIELDEISNAADVNFELMESLDASGAVGAALVTGMEDLAGNTRRSLEPLLAFIRQLDEAETIMGEVENSADFLDNFEEAFFEKPMNRFRKELNKVRTAFFGLAMGIGGIFLPTLNAIMPVLNSALKGFAGAFQAIAVLLSPIKFVTEAFRDLLDTFPRVKKGLDVVVQGLGIMGGTFSAIVLGIAIGSLESLQKVVRGTANVFVAATNKILVATGKQAAATQMMQTMQSKLGTIIKQNTRNFVQLWKGFGTKMLNIIKSTNTTASGSYTQMFKSIVSRKKGFTGRLIGIMGAFGSKLKAIFVRIGSSFKFLLGPWGLVVAAVIGGIVILEKKFGIFSKAWKKVTDFIAKNSHVIGSVMHTLVDFIINKVLIRWVKWQAWQVDQVLKFLGILLEESAGVFGAMWGVYRNFLSNVFDWVESIGSTLEDVLFAFRKFGFKSKKFWKTLGLAWVRLSLATNKAILKIIRDLVDGILFIQVKFFESLVDINVRVWTGIWKIIKKVGIKIKDTVTDNWDGLGAWLSNKWAGLTKMAASFGQKLVDAIVNPFGAGLKLAKKGLDAIKDGFNSFFSDSESDIEDGTAGMEEGFESGLDKLTDGIFGKLVDLGTRVKNTIEMILDPDETFDNLKEFQNKGTAIGEAILGPVIDILDRMEGSVEERMDQLLGERPKQVEKIMESLRQKLPTEEDVTAFVTKLAQKLQNSPLQGMVEKLELSSDNIDKMLRKIAAFMGVASAAADEQSDAAEEQQDVASSMMDIAKVLDEKDIEQQITLSPQVFVTVEEDMNPEDFRRQFVPQINKELQRQLKDLGLLSDTNIRGA